MMVSWPLGLTLAMLSGPPESLAVRECNADPLVMPGDTERALESTLLVATEDGAGSAVVISPDGFALTAAHVVAGREEVTVHSSDDTTTPARVVRIDRDHDVALLRLDTRAPVPCLDLSMVEARLGSDVFVLGSPGGTALSFSVSKGIVSAYREFADTQFVQVDASVNPGNSGGPVVSADGLLLGIMSWKLSDVSLEGLAFAVTATEALEVLGVALDAETSEGWETVAPVRTVAPPSPRTAPDAETPARIRRRRAKRGLLIGGIAVGATGATVIGASAFLFRRWDRMSRKEWKRLRASNTAGWVALGAGLSLATLGIALPKAKRGDRQLSLTPAGVEFGGRF